MKLQALAKVFRSCSETRMEYDARSMVAKRGFIVQDAAMRALVCGGRGALAREAAISMS